MPTYSYRCADCGHAFDIHQAFTDDTLTVCPNCGGDLRKIFSPVGVTFSGSGFYRTDSRSGPSGSGTGSTGGSSDASSSSSTTSPTPSTPASGGSTSGGTGTSKE